MVGATGRLGISVSVLVSIRVSPPQELFVLASFVLAAAMLSGDALPAGEGAYSEADFDSPNFLIGRWTGKGPDGKPFFEEYVRLTPTKLQSNRYPMASFTDPTDHSQISLEDGKIWSRWGEFTWTANAVEAGKICFEPVNAPSAFCWEHRSDSIAEVTQRWQDQAGVEQSYTLKLERFAP